MTQIGSARPPSSSASSATGDTTVADVPDESGAVQQTSSRPRKRQRQRATEFTRSRGGCEACKHHKKKCDQQHPVCSRCRTGQKACRYPAPIIWASAASIAAPENPPQDRETPSGHEPPPDPFVSPRAQPSDYYRNAGVSYSNQGNRADVVAISPELLTTGRSEHNHHAVDYAANNASTSPWDTLLPVPLPPSGLNAASTSFAEPPTSIPQNATTDWSFGGDAFLQALFALAPSQPDLSVTQSLLSGPISTAVTEPITPRRQTNGPLAVPIDCDPALWAFFVDTSRWEEQEPNDDERSLLEYYMNSTAFGVVIQDGSARRFFQECASRAKVEKGRALMHAVLCLSAQHLSNKARTEDDRSRIKRYRDISTEHRAQALHLLRVAAAAKSHGEAADILPAIMILLILATFLKGEPGIIPSFLDQTSKLLDKATASMSTSEADLAFLPSVSALHSMYTAFHSLNAQKQINLSSLFPSRDARPIWEERSCDVLETVVGMPKAVLMLLLKANDLVLEYETVMKALSRDAQDDELGMMRIELQARASALDADLDDEESWGHQSAHGLSERVWLGQECCRIAARVMILVDVLDDEIDSPRILGLIDRFADQLDACGPRLEVGLIWPYMVVASHAPARLRPRMSAFIKRAQWKGSAMPLIAEAVVEEVWRDTDSGESGKTWRSCVLARGGPIIL